MNDRVLGTILEPELTQYRALLEITESIAAHHNLPELFRDLVQKLPRLKRDDILDNITITWLTNTALSGARLYWVNWRKLEYFNAKGVFIPVAMSVFPDELYPAPRSWAERAYPKFI